LRLPDGKRIVRKRRDLKALEAEAMETVLRLERTGRLPGAEPCTVEQKFHRWMEEKVRPFKKRRTVEAYEWAGRYIVACLGNVRVDRLTEERVQAMASSLARGEMGKLSPASVHSILRALSAMLGRRAWREIGSELERPAPSPPRSRVLSQDELDRLLRELFESEQADRWLIQFILNTGLRVSEACGLKWSSVDFQNRTVSVGAQLSKDGKSLEPVKTESGRRVLPLNSAAMEALQAEWERQAAERKPGLDPPVEWAFATRSGKPRLQRNVLRAFKAAAERAGVPDATLHDLRRTYITSLAEANVPESVVQAIAGHASAQTTRQHYVFARQAAMESAAGKVEFRPVI
jgi:integrase